MFKPIRAKKCHLTDYYIIEKQSYNFIDDLVDNERYLNDLVDKKKLGRV
jgi:hypothetical protein